MNYLENIKVLEAKRNKILEIRDSCAGEVKEDISDLHLFENRLSGSYAKIIEYILKIMDEKTNWGMNSRLIGIL